MTGILEMAVWRVKKSVSYDTKQRRPAPRQFSQQHLAAALLLTCQSIYLNQRRLTNKTSNASIYFGALT
jgi:hypothetical protein